jgi:putative membrane protein
LIHFGFFYLETIFWGNRVPKSFPFPPNELTEVVAIFALNQGAYNLVVAIGLILSSRIVRILSYETALYLCLSMTLAGIVGGITATWMIAAFQAAPALIAAAVIFAALRRQAAAP